VKLTVVGCSGSYPGPDSPASCYLLEEADETGRVWRVVMDLGSGALGALHRYVDPLTIDAVILSHLHADHCLDLCGYYVMRKYHPTGSQPRLPVYGPSGTADRMARAYDLPLDPGMHQEFDFITWAPGEPVRVGPFTIQAIAVDHPVEAYGLRVFAGGSLLAYTGDTGLCPQLAAVARGADLLLAEASFYEGVANPPGIHLTGKDCGDLASESGAGRLVVTHVPPWHDAATMLAEAVAVWGGETVLAHAGAVYDF
jgi:ribonuclease BN (tRNA processing enzyme)